MSRPANGRARRRAGLAALAVLTAGCAGCTDYLARRDTLTLASGEAVHANIAEHVIDPWPRHAATIDPYSDGSLAQRAVERYRNPVAGPNLGGLAPVPVGPGAAPPPAPPPLPPS